jgi:hypothetical protein
MAEPNRFHSYAEFFAFYLRQQRNPETAGCMPLERPWAL